MKIGKTEVQKDNTTDVTVVFNDGIELVIGGPIEDLSVKYSGDDPHYLDIFSEEEVTNAIDFAHQYLQE